MREEIQENVGHGFGEPWPESLGSILEDGSVRTVYVSHEVAVQQLGLLGA